MYSVISSQLILGMTREKKKKMQEKLLQQSHTAGQSEVAECLLESYAKQQPHIRKMYLIFNYSKTGADTKALCPSQ